jgi:single-strand DNA-binding protein
MGIGNIGRDPESKALQSGTVVCNFSIAIPAGWGEKKSTMWVNCQVFGKQADVAMKYLHKGKQVAVLGELSLREYTSNGGEKKTSLELTVESFKMLGGKEEAGHKPVSANSTNTGSTGRRQVSEGPAADEYEDDLPPF